MNGLNKQFCSFASCLAVATLTFAGTAIAATPDVDNVKAIATASATSAGVADPIDVTVEVTVPDGARVQFPKLTDQVGNFEVTDHRDVFDVPTDQGRKYTRRMTIETLQTGQQTIPVFEIAYRDRGDAASEIETVRTTAIPITIESAITTADQPTEFRDLKNVVFLDQPATSGSTPWWIWAIGGTFALTGPLGFVFIRKLLKGTTPKQRALKSLEQLDVGGGDADVIYAETTQILKTFIERQFNFPATRQTTDEFVTAVQSDSRLDEGIKDRFEQFLAAADLVKFSGASCTPAMLQEAIDRARQFVLIADEQRTVAMKQKTTVKQIANPTHQQKEISQCS